MTIVVSLLVCMLVQTLSADTINLVLEVANPLLCQREFLLELLYQRHLC